MYDKQDQCREKLGAFVPAGSEDCKLADMVIPWALRGALLHNLCVAWFIN